MHNFLLLATTKSHRTITTRVNSGDASTTQTYHNNIYHNELEYLFQNIYKFELL